MNLNTRRYWPFFVFAILMFWNTSGANELSVETDGVAVYLGIVPAEVACVSAARLRGWDSRSTLD